MAKITFSPVEELVIHEAVEVTREDLFRERITPQGNLPLYWCDGILFSFSSLPLTDEVVRDYLKGKIHWAEVHFSKMEQYQPIIQLEAEEYKTTMSIRVINTGKSILHKELIKWLKSKK